MKKNENLNFPTISVVIATYNSKNTIAKSLQSVRNQEYPQKKIEIIIVDGSSSDETIVIVKKFNVTLKIIPPKKQNAEYNKGVGIKLASGDLLLMIDHDNVLPHKKWLQKMVRPFLDDKKIVGVETLRYHYDKKGSMLDKYFALYGAGDPLAYYLGKADRLSFIYDRYNLAGTILKSNPYYVVEFQPDNVSTIGANGFMIRREILLKYAKADVNNYFHIDVNVDLIKKGFKRYAFIKDDIIHLTGYKSLQNFLYRRALFMQQYHVKATKRRRFRVYMKGDTLKLSLFILFSLTFVKPTFDAARGYLRIHDKAWFLHPVLCFTLTVIYGILTVNNKVKAYAKN